MKGIFLSKMRGITHALFFLIVGTVGGFLFGRMILADIANASLPSLVFCLLFLLFFLLLGCLGLALLLFNSGAYFIADDAGIKTKFGLYSDKQWKWSEILRVDIGGSTLIVTLQNNREYHVGPLTNAKDLFRYCKDRVPTRTLPPAETIREQMRSAKKMQKRYIVYIAVSVALLFASILIAACFVGEDLQAVNTAQTVVFLCCTSSGLAAVVSAFVLAERSGKYTTALRQLENDLIQVLSPARAKEALAYPKIIRILYFEDHRYHLFIHKNEVEETVLYAYFMQAFDRKTEDWTILIYASPCFSTEQDLLEDIYSRYEDTVFEEYKD